MALANLAAFTAALQNPLEGASLSFATGTVATSNAGRLYDAWAFQVPAGTAPTTAAVPTRTTAGAFGQQNGGSGALGIVGMNLGGGLPVTVLVADRLSHQGGLSGTVATAQTTNLPTSALTRYTDGVGVMIALTIYTQIGTTATTVTASYTNQSGTSGRTTPAVAIGGTFNREANRLFPLPLQSGDTGVRSVESVTLAATTGPAGAFGVMLFKPLYASSAFAQGNIIAADFVTGNAGGGLPEIVDDACLFPIIMGTTTTSFFAANLLTTEW